MLPYKFVGYTAVTDDGGEYECSGACDGHFGYPCSHCTWLSVEKIESLRLELKRLKSLPTDCAEIKLSMLDSKSDLQDLMDDCERFRT